MTDELRLTKGEAESVADFIEFHFLDTIKKDKELDNLQYVWNILSAFRKLCEFSGYESLTLNDTGDNEGGVVADAQAMSNTDGDCESDNEGEGTPTATDKLKYMLSNQEFAAFVGEVVDRCKVGDCEKCHLGTLNDWGSWTCQAGVYARGGVT